MFNLDAVEILKDSLQERGTALLTDINGSRLTLISNKVLGITNPCILISYEGYGSFYYEFDRPLNAFRLISAGFSLRVAQEVSDLINKLVELLNNHTLVKGKCRKTTRKSIRIKNEQSTSNTRH